MIQKILLFKMLCLLLLASSAQAANITATLDRNPVMLDESFRLVLESDGSVDESPDLSALYKDFDVLTHSHSSNMTYTNGTLSRKSVWSIALMGKKAGTFTIPSIPFGKDNSPALRITIKEATVNANPSKGGSEIYLEVDVDNNQPWIESQVIYTVKLFSRLALSNLRSSEVTTSDTDAIIKQLGDSKTYEVLRGGLRFAVREYRFAIYPQHSGELTISPMIFEGRLSRNRSQSIFDQFLNTGELRRIRSKGVTLNVRARPSNIKTSEWIPASKLSLHEEWSEDITQLKAGEPVTRTITINAAGPLATYLPDIEFDEAEDIKQYPDKPVFEDRVTDKGVASTKQIKVAMIPTRAGDYKLPAISVPWWNTNMGRKEIAHLPEVILKATGIASNTTPPPVQPVQQAMPEKTVKQAPQETVPELLMIKTGYWPWISLVLATGWLITLIMLLRSRNSNARLEAEKPGPVPALTPLEKSVNRYCTKNDPHKTKDALLEWAKARWPEHNISSLVDISELTDQETGKQIQALNAVLYSPSQQQWNSSKLAQAFNSFRKQKLKPDNVSESALKPLYKAAS